MTSTTTRTENSHPCKVVTSFARMFAVCFQLLVPPFFFRAYIAIGRHHRIAIAQTSRQKVIVRTSVRGRALGLKYARDRSSRRLKRHLSTLPTPPLPPSLSPSPPPRWLFRYLPRYVGARHLRRTCACACTPGDVCNPPSKLLFSSDCWAASAQSTRSITPTG